MNVVFRTDASVHIGTGHVMRCLTLADLLRQRGVSITFISQFCPCNLLEYVRSRGYEVHALEHKDSRSDIFDTDAGNHRAEYYRWLGASQEEDALASIQILRAIDVDLLVVDHYALDKTWESMLRPYVNRIMIIDDLADRQHDCDYLLDQNIGRDRFDYEGYVSEQATLFMGPKYALLRPEFLQYRDYSLNRRKNNALESVLISLGGIDNDNVTGTILEALAGCNLPSCIHISVVMGRQAPNLVSVCDIASNMPWNVEVVVDVSDMARLMSESDISIGAAGSTAWERCCLGLPTIMVVIAKNQEYNAGLLERIGAALPLDKAAIHASELQARFDLCSRPEVLGKMQRSCMTITDGMGASRIAEVLGYGE